MKKTGIFYGSTGGNTSDAARAIASALGIEAGDVKDISNATTDELASYDVLLLGSSTWGIGDLQDDWEGFISDLEGMNLSGKYVAVFGTGDSASYPDSFCDAMATLAEAAEKAGATIIGKGVPTSGYSFDDSRAVDGDTFIGLPLDADNEDDKTEGRIGAWVARLKAEAGI